MDVSERSNQERGRRTRERLVEATVDCLVAHGFASTTMQRVQSEAGVSRGALVHHFASMNELLVGAVHHVAARQLETLRHTAAQLDDDGVGREQRVRLLHSLMSGPLFLAGLELWVAARTNPSLRAALVPAERELGRQIAAALADGDTTKGMLTNLELDELLFTLRGLAITSVLRTDPRVERRMIEHWLETKSEKFTTSHAD